MATFTDEEITNQTLEHLGVKATGQAADPGDYEKAHRAYRSTYRQLRRRGHAPWPIDAVEEEASEPLIVYLAGKICTKFGFTGQQRIEAKAEAVEARKELIESARGVKQPLQTRFRDF